MLAEAVGWRSEFPALVWSSLACRSHVEGKGVDARSAAVSAFLTAFQGIKTKPRV